jgi:hypothetical protein
MGAPAYLAPDQPGMLQRPDVLRGGGERDGEGPGELADRPLASGEGPQHVPAGGIAEGVEDGIELGGVLFNHAVEYACGRTDCQPFG